MERAPARDACDLPCWLSCLPQKLAVFARDAAFCRGWNTILELEQEGKFARSHLWNLGSVMFKPDSLIRRNTQAGMQALTAAGFAIRAGATVRFSDSLAREFWRHALGRYTDQRMALLARLMELAPSVYLLVRATQPSAALPTALRLTDFKGEAVPGARTAGALRAMLGAPQTAMFNYVHTADEPADVVRELGLLFAAPTRRSLLLGALAGQAPEALALAEQAMRAAPRSDLEFAAALGRLRAALGAADGAAVPPAHALLLRIEQGDEQAWPALAELLADMGIALAPLDRLILDCQHVVLKRQQISQPFPSCEVRHWLASGIAAPADAWAK